MSLDQEYLYGNDDNPIYLYDDPTYNEDFDDRFPFIYETNKIYEKIYILQDLNDACAKEINNYSFLKTKYGQAVFSNNFDNTLFKNKIEENIQSRLNKCSTFQEEINKLNILLDKIDTVKKINTNKKQVLYDYYKVLGYSKRRFANLLLDKSEELYIYSKSIIYDVYISDEELRQVLEVIFVLQEDIQLKEGDLINYFRLLI